MRFSAFPETEINHGQLSHLVEALLADAVVTNTIYIFKGEGNYLILVFQAFPGERHADVESGVFAGVHPCACGKAFYHACAFQNVKQAAGAFVAQQVGNVGCGFTFIVTLLRGDRERQRHAAIVFQRLGCHFLWQPGGVVQRVRVNLGFKVTVGDGAKALLHHAFQLIQWLWAVDCQGHDVRRIVFFPETNQVRPKRVVFGVFQGLEVADCKLAEGMIRIARSLPDREQAPSVILEFGAVLRVDGIALTIHQFRGEQGRRKLLGEPIQRRFQKLGFDIKEIVGVFKRRKRVMTAAVAANKLLVFARLRVLLGAQKQHVLKKMCQACPLFRVVTAAHGDVHGGGGFVGFRVRSEDHP